MCVMTGFIVVLNWTNVCTQKFIIWGGGGGGDLLSYAKLVGFDALLCSIFNTFSG